MFKRHSTALPFKEAVRKYGSPPAVIPERDDVFETDEDQREAIQERLARVTGGGKDE